MQGLLCSSSGLSSSFFHVLIHCSVLLCAFTFSALVRLLFRAAFFSFLSSTFFIDSADIQALWLSFRGPSATLQLWLRLPLLPSTSHLCFFPRLLHLALAGPETCSLVWSWISLLLLDLLIVLCWISFSGTSHLSSSPQLQLDFGNEKMVVWCYVSSSSSLYI